MAIDPQIADRLVIVVLKTGGDLRIGETFPLQHRQIRDGIIATPFAEFRHKGIRPVRLIVNFDAIGKHEVHGIQTQTRFEDLLCDVGKMGLCRVGIEVIDNQAL